MPKKEAKGEKKTKIIKDLVLEILSFLGVSSEVEILENKEDSSFVVNLKTENEAGLIIGRRGESLDSLQFVLSMILRQRLGEWVRVVLNVNDWRDRQEEHLKEIALQAAQRARETVTPQPLYNLSSSQRRIVHLVLAKESDIETESFGEGEERYLVIKSKAK